MDKTPILINWVESVLLFLNVVTSLGVLQNCLYRGGVHEQYSSTFNKVLVPRRRVETKCVRANT